MLDTMHRGISDGAGEPAADAALIALGERFHAAVDLYLAELGRFCKMRVQLNERYDELRPPGLIASDTDLQLFTDAQVSPVEGSVVVGRTIDGIAIDDLEENANLARLRPEQKERRKALVQAYSCWLAACDREEKRLGAHREDATLGKLVDEADAIAMLAIKTPAKTLRGLAIKAAMAEWKADNHSPRHEINHGDTRDKVAWTIVQDLLDSPESSLHLALVDRYETATGRRLGR